jgi:hypothetical protein
MQHPYLHCLSEMLGPVGKNNDHEQLQGALVPLHIQLLMNAHPGAQFRIDPLKSWICSSHIVSLKNSLSGGNAGSVGFEGWFKLYAISRANTVAACAATPCLDVAFK